MTQLRRSPRVDFGRRVLALGLACAPAVGFGAAAAPRVPILVYHRFAAQAQDSMTVRIENFRSHLDLLQRLQCQVVPLSEWVAWRLAWALGERAALPSRTVVLTADDGHRTQFEVMAPMLRDRGWPATLFVYPSAISNAGYAMTWAQLRELAVDPLFAVQSHTFWHPNLVRDRAHMPAAAFQRFAADQLVRSRETLLERLGRPVTLLAWPFGLSDEGLAQQAREAGYVAAFSLGNRSAMADGPLFDVPRHLIVDSVDARQLGARLEAAFNGKAVS
ncbi:polysaccharide deacetylase family protein [Roseateles sp.]|uniref:polysaccharide deacetylase family protein n=1 Tax=Roseateles sp. TaxID=1971397 RepID=UPI0025EDF7D9|nr:polysaccharide deacetylase family protein [Roseateles sp.]MBV8036873.1 polysaccharide deacetylase family protein [Roseateles sp.]